MYCRVKQPSADAVKRPHVDQQREAVGKRDPDVGGAGEAAVRRQVRSLQEGHQVAGVGKVKKEESADKLARRGHEVSVEDAQVGGVMVAAGVCFEGGRHFGSEVWEAGYG